MLAYAMQSMKHREVGRENMRKQGVIIPSSETFVAFTPFYHASKLTRPLLNSSPLLSYLIVICILINQWDNRRSASRASSSVIRHTS